MIKMIIATGLFFFPIVVAMALSSTFQDPRPLIFDLFGWLLCIFGALYLLVALVMRSGRPFISKSLVIISPVLFIAGEVFALNWYQPPVDDKLPEKLVYYKFAHVEDVYDPEAEAMLTAYKYLDTPLTKAETDTLIRILEETGRTFIAGKNGEILIPGSNMLNAGTMSWISGMLEERMNKK